jgi:hypothetical protein
MTPSQEKLAAVAPCRELDHQSDPCGTLGDSSSSLDYFTTKAIDPTIVAIAILSVVTFDSNFRSWHSRHGQCRFTRDVQHFKSGFGKTFADYGARGCALSPYFVQSEPNELARCTIAAREIELDTSCLVGLGIAWRLASRVGGPQGGCLTASLSPNPFLRPNYYSPFPASKYCQWTIICLFDGS